MSSPMEVEVADCIIVSLCEERVMPSNKYDPGRGTLWTYHLEVWNGHPDKPSGDGLGYGGHHGDEYGDGSGAGSFDYTTGDGRSGFYDRQD